MEDELHLWTIDAKKWRVRNGFTAPEWIMYGDWILVRSFVICLGCGIAGFVAGVMSSGV